MRNIKASVIIPNWNGQQLLKDCLSSLVKQSFKDFEIILVDNNSSDDSLKFVLSNYPQVRVIKLHKNFGFARAINEGVKQSTAEYVIFLNNDTWVEKDWLENLIKCAEAHPEVISVNSKLINFYHRKIIDGVGILINEVGQARSIGWLWFAGFSLFGGILMLVRAILKLHSGASSIAPVHTTEQVKVGAEIPGSETMGTMGHG